MLRLKSILRGVVVASGLVVAAGGASAQIKMNLADAYPPTEFMNISMQKWADDLHRVLGGRGAA